MSSWPSNWINWSLTFAGIEVNAQTITIMKAWRDSTPLPPYTNNPIGMPAGSSGAPALLNTKYGLFANINLFYDAFRTFMATYQGKQLAAAMISDNPYPATWRAISSLNWPGSETETDYPAVILDKTTEAYQASVNASAADSRKTSGQVAPRTEAASVVLANARSLAEASQVIADGSKLTTYLLRRHAQDG